jgi:2-polyprenyl-3-methyl-5-hydroxy-6-metoxy-1,4-benzoquinol methylase
MNDLKEPNYSDNLTKEFEVFYPEEKAVLRRAIDKIFRKGVKEGYALALQECRNVNGKRILNVGCRNGPMLAELARKGAYVVGIESSGGMTEKTKLTMEEKGLQDRFTLLHDDFERHMFDEKFNISIALEIFDFTKDAASYVRKMKSLTSEKCIMSFPSKFAFQVPLRMIWLRSRNLPLYFYTKEDLKHLFSQHFAHYKIKSISARYFCVASVQDKNKNSSLRL